MALREEELVLLFETFDAMIDEAITRHTSIEHNVPDYESYNVDELKQKCIDVIAFGEKHA